MMSSDSPVSNVYVQLSSSFSRKSEVDDWEQLSRPASSLDLQSPRCDSPYVHVTPEQSLYTNRRGSTCSPTPAQHAARTSTASTTNDLLTTASHLDRDEHTPGPHDEGLHEIADLLPLLKPKLQQSQDIIQKAAVQTEDIKLCSEERALEHEDQKRTIETGAQEAHTITDKLAQPLLQQQHVDVAQLKSGEIDIDDLQPIGPIMPHKPSLWRFVVCHMPLVMLSAIAVISVAATVIIVQHRKGGPKPNLVINAPQQASNSNTQVAQNA